MHVEHVQHVHLAQMKKFACEKFARDKINVSNVSNVSNVQGNGSRS